MTLRIGVLGAAGITPRALIAPAAGMDDIELTCVAARDRSRAEQFAARHGIGTVHDSYADVVTDPEIDAVYNPLQISGHKEWTLRALEAGKHVLCEKPHGAQRGRGPGDSRRRPRDRPRLRRGVSLLVPPGGAQDARNRPERPARPRALRRRALPQRRRGRAAADPLPDRAGRRFNDGPRLLPAAHAAPHLPGRAGGRLGHGRDRARCDRPHDGGRSSASPAA